MNINIIDNRVEFKSKSFSNYKKKQLFFALKTCILNKNYKESIYFFHEIFISGYYKDLYIFFINFYMIYIHVGNPYLLSLLFDRYDTLLDHLKFFKKSNIFPIKLRKSQEFLENTFTIFKIIFFSPKKCIFDLIPPFFNDRSRRENIHFVNKKKFKNKNELLYDKDDMNIILKHLDNFDYYLKQYSMSSRNKKRIDASLIELKNNIFYWFGKYINEEFYESSINISETLLTIKYSPNNSKIKELYPKLWNIILINSKNVNSEILKSVKQLYNFWKNKVSMLKTTTIVAIFFILYNPARVMSVKRDIDSEDINYINVLNVNVNKSVNELIERKDYIKLKTSSKTKKNKVEKQIKKNTIKYNNEKKRKITNIEKKMKPIKKTNPIKELKEKKEQELQKRLNNALQLEIIPLIDENNIRSQSSNDSDKNTSKNIEFEDKHNRNRRNYNSNYIIKKDI